MGGRRTNLALLLLLPLALLTGTIAYAVGAPSGRAVVIGHGVLGLGILVLSPWKTALARRSARRRERGRGASLLLALLVVVTVVSGIAHTGGVRALGWLPFVPTAMHLHVGAALASIPLAVWHVVARPVSARRSDASRRTVLRASALSGAAVALWLGAEGAQRVLGTPGARRRFTGSHEQGTDDPPRMPVIQWFTDSVQDLDDDAWCLSVSGLDRGSRTLALTDLRDGAESVRATIDCTSGWYAAQEWRGVRLDRLLAPELDAATHARSIVVVSTTGYARRFPVRDGSRLWLATGYAGTSLASAHGAPARLVAPGRRGFWWVKWVTEVHIDDAPWWRQPPFPLQ